MEKYREDYQMALDFISEYKKRSQKRNREVKQTKQGATPKKSKHDLSLKQDVILSKSHKPENLAILPNPKEEDIQDESVLIKNPLLEEYKINSDFSSIEKLPATKRTINLARNITTEQIEQIEQIQQEEMSKFHAGNCLHVKPITKIDYLVEKKRKENSANKADEVTTLFIEDFAVLRARDYYKKVNPINQPSCEELQYAKTLFPSKKTELGRSNKKRLRPASYQKIIEANPFDLNHNVNARIINEVFNQEQVKTYTANALRFFSPKQDDPSSTLPKRTKTIRPLTK